MPDIFDAAIAAIPPERAYKPTALDPKLEAQFQDWVRQTDWYKAPHWGERGPDLDHGDYDYRGAWLAGAGPGQGASAHWPSVAPTGRWLKAPTHETAWKEMFLEMSGINPDDLGVSREDAVAFIQKNVKGARR